MKTLKDLDGKTKVNYLFSTKLQERIPTLISLDFDSPITKVKLFWELDYHYTKDQTYNTNMFFYNTENKLVHMIKDFEEFKNTNYYKNAHSSRFSKPGNKRIFIDEPVLEKLLKDDIRKVISSLKPDIFNNLNVAYKNSILQNVSMNSINRPLSFIEECIPELICFNSELIQSQKKHDFCGTNPGTGKKIGNKRGVYML
ncbi:MAG: hypothetical protein ACOC16_02560 [Nanoarchaeota archaeon]